MRWCVCCHGSALFPHVFSLCSSRHTLLPSSAFMHEPACSCMKAESMSAACSRFQLTLFFLKPHEAGQFCLPAIGEEEQRMHWQRSVIWELIWLLQTTHLPWRAGRHTTNEAQLSLRLKERLCVVAGLVFSRLSLWSRAPL